MREFYENRIKEIKDHVDYMRAFQDLTNCTVPEIMSSHSSSYLINRFPNNEFRNRWKKIINRPNLVITKKSVICSTHFEPHFFINHPIRRKLVPNAVPTIVIDCFINNAPGIITEETLELNENDSVKNQSSSSSSVCHMANHQPKTPSVNASVKWKATMALARSQMEKYFIEHDINTICRLCGVPSNDELVEIFGKNSMEDLGVKISKYLPVEICEDDVLPTQVCGSCANNVLNWDVLYNRCLNADKDFKILLSEEKLIDDTVPEGLIDTKKIETKLFEESDHSRIELQSVASQWSLTDKDSSNDLDNGCEDMLQSIKYEYDSEIGYYELEGNLTTDSESTKEETTHDYGKQTKVQKRKCVHFTLYCESCEADIINKTDAIDGHLAQSKDLCKFTCKSCNRYMTSKVIERTCQICDKRFPSKSYMRSHILEHQEISCNVCEKKFKTYINLVSHKSIHSGLGSYVMCQICGWLTRRKFNLQLHIISHVSDNFCNLCCASFNTEQNLDKHKSVQHQNELEYYDATENIVQCENCEQSFNSKLKLYEHFLKEHEDQNKTFICECGRPFETESMLKMHERIHHNKGTLKCDICYKEFSRYKSFREHTNSHSNYRPFACNLCDKSFKYSSNLAQHKNMHKGIKRYKCTECDRSFSRSTTLDNHIKIHRNEKDYVCEHCFVAFIQLSSLRKHIRTMHRKCERCGKIVGDKKEYLVHKWKYCAKLQVSQHSSNQELCFAEPEDQINLATNQADQ